MYGSCSRDLTEFGETEARRISSSFSEIFSTPNIVTENED